MENVHCDRGKQSHKPSQLHATLLARKWTKKQSLQMHMDSLIKLTKEKWLTLKLLRAQNQPQASSEQ